MSTTLIEIEGEWEEVVARANEFAGRRVRLIVLPSKETDIAEDLRAAPGTDLLRHAGSWVGDDLDECLANVYAGRGRARS